LRANVDIKLSKYVKTGVRLNVSRNYQRANKVNFHHLLQQVLTARSIYNKDGLFTGVNPVSASVRANPIAKIKLMNKHNYVTNILGNAYLQVNPIKGLTLKTTIGPEVNYRKQDIYKPSTLPLNRIGKLGGSGSVGASNFTNLLNNNTIEYTTDINANN